MKINETIVFTLNEEEIKRAIEEYIIVYTGNDKHPISVRLAAASEGLIAVASLSSETETD